MKKLNLKSKLTFRQNAELLAQGAEYMYLWTITSKQTTEPKVFTRQMNNCFRQLKRKFQDFAAVRVWEYHTGKTMLINGITLKNKQDEATPHGLHCHLLTPRFLNVIRVREVIKQHKKAIFQVNVVKVPTLKGLNYLSKYLSKSERPDCMKSARMWSTINFDAMQIEKAYVKDLETNSFRSYLVKQFIASPTLLGERVRSAIGYNPFSICNTQWQFMQTLDTFYFDLLFSDFANTCPITAYH